MPNKIIAGAVKTIREDRGFSQSELARRAGIAKATVSELEAASGRSTGIDTLSKIADALDVDLVTLIGVDPQTDASRLEEIGETAAATALDACGVQLAPATEAPRRLFRARAGYSLHPIRLHPGDILVATTTGEPAKAGPVVILNKGRASGFEVRLYLDPYLIGPDGDGLLRHDMKQSPDIEIIGEIVARIGTLA